MITIEYLAGDGKTALKIEVAEDIMGRAEATAYINGKYEYTGRPTPTTRGDIVATLGRVGLKQDRYEQVMAAIEAVQGEIDARPAEQLRKLIAQREALVAKIGYIIDAQGDDHEARIETARATGIYHAETRDYAAEIEAARKAVADFDAAHPEVVTKIKTDRDASVARFLAAD